ncbi:MAG: 4'-phosphopantetheinyl transferase superfamily protein [Pseudonocardiaceae bacterium]|nr:4'-phosphopantetheinyl transferase superfamily protein [Pseudonocardiaceae bacterium]
MAGPARAKRGDASTEPSEDMSRGPGRGGRLRAGGAEGCLVLWARPDGDPKLLRVLDAPERARHAALRLPADRARFAAAHALARAALGCLLDAPPTALRLTRRCAHCGGPHGPPRLEPPAGVELSLAHSGDQVAVALAPRRVGVDVEQVTDLPDGDGVARQALTPAERAAVHGGPGLLTVWTRKEAAVKATGHGLAAPLHDLVVTGPDEAAGVVSWTGAAAPTQAVHLADLSPAAGHVGCVALIGGPAPVVEERAGDDLLAALPR